ncbi:NnrS family protein [Tritonibacter scottomollicae]|uniref:NnrS family protein n=1 Tax=Tritonibacter scottomollicae TaxID=483013 RepID=UPI003AA80A71
MDNTDRLALRHKRTAASPPFLRGGFRPFFLLGPCWAIGALLIWIWSLAGGPVQIGQLDALAWHRHEMLFGFIGAIVAGFILTAIPNWTGKLPVAGMPLAALVAWWMLGRAIHFIPSGTHWSVFALIDASFYFGLAAIAARETIKSGNRNLPAVILIALLGIANVLDLAGAAGVIDWSLGSRLGIGLMVMMISIIGGRIVPSFTRNWLQKNGAKHPLPVQPARFDMLVLIVTAIAMLLWVFAQPGQLVGVALVLAALFQALRLARWQGWRCISDRLVLILHLGYLWIPIGLGLLGATELDAPIPTTSGLHALTAGAMATMILAVMTRSILRYTGRALHADMGTHLIYAAILTADALRVFAGLGPVDTMALVQLSGALWIAAFGLFITLYGPNLVLPRVDGKPF